MDKFIGALKQNLYLPNYAHTASNEKKSSGSDQENLRHAFFQNCVVILYLFFDHYEILLGMVFLLCADIQRQALRNYKEKRRASILFDSYSSHSYVGRKGNG